MHALQVPIIIHNESEQAKTWTQVSSEKTKKQSIPVITAWQLNERMYGDFFILARLLSTGNVNKIDVITLLSSAGTGSYRV